MLGVNSNTVFRALHTLRDEGLLEFSRGHGVSVTGVGPQRSAVVTKARELVKLARLLRLPARRVVADNRAGFVDGANVTLLDEPGPDDSWRHGSRRAHRGGAATPTAKAMGSRLARTARSGWRCHRRGHEWRRSPDKPTAAQQDRSGERAGDVSAPDRAGCCPCYPFQASSWRAVTR